METIASATSSTIDGRVRLELPETATMFQSKCSLFKVCDWTGGWQIQQRYKLPDYLSTNTYPVSHTLVRAELGKSSKVL